MTHCFPLVVIRQSYAEMFRAPEHREKKKLQKKDGWMDGGEEGEDKMLLSKKRQS